MHASEHTLRERVRLCDRELQEIARGGRRPHGAGRGEAGRDCATWVRLQIRILSLYALTGRDVEKCWTSTACA